jgi:hypothetical protein
MQANVETAEVFVGDVSTVYETIRACGARVLNGENLKDVALFAATVGSLGVVLYGLYRAMETWTITGGGPAGFGYF